MLLQFLIVNERVRDEDADDDDPDPGVSETWKFTKDHWNLDKPSLIICIVYDLENSFMNRRLLKSILADLVKAAAEVEGKQFGRAPSTISSTTVIIIIIIIRCLADSLYAKHILYG